MAKIGKMLLAQLYPHKRRGLRQLQQIGTKGKLGLEKYGIGERKRKRLEREDFLLEQIDELREKAKQLQDLIASKESKAEELQSIVNEREDKAQELESILTERQEEAGKIVTEFTATVDELANKVTAKLAEMELGVAGQIEEAKRLSREQTEGNKEFSQELIAENRKFLEEQTTVSQNLLKEQMTELRELLETAAMQFESIKTELSDKVHSENVKCYRNIQDLFTEFNTKLEKIDKTEKDTEITKTYIKCLTWFSVLNFVVLIGYILHMLGVFVA